MASESQPVADKPTSKRQAWFCTTGLPSDIVVEVHDMAFHLHKFPLMSKSRKLHNLITELEANCTTPTRENQNLIGEEDEVEVEEEQYHIVLSDFPGGSEIFEMASKFCYGVKIDLNSSNVAPLRCAGEFLEMTEEYSEENLISKTERFLSQNVLKSIKDSIRTLKSCEPVMPLAEALDIPQRCIASIASKAPSADPALFGWPVSDGANGAQDHLKQMMLWNGIETGGRKKSGGGRGSKGVSWFEDLAQLSLPLFKRLISAMRDQDVNSEIIESCLMNYAKKYIPGVSRSNRKPLLPSSSSSSSSLSTETEQKELLETIISNLPLEKSSKTSTAIRFLFGLLRTANILNASEACKAALENKIGSQLDQATLDDLLIPSYSYLNETLYDVDCAERILSYFLDGIDEENAVVNEANQTEVDGLRSPALMIVGKLIDGYLAEIASDANLKLEKFYNLAISLPEQSRLFDDGVYRAVDVYLKAHPWISEAEREKICGVMDCQKLTLEACTHAAQNDRLPLRAVVQVLFFEQLQLRHAIAGTLLAAESVPVDAGRFSAVSRRETEGVGEETEEEEEVVSAGPIADENGTWRETARENQMLRLDMDSMRTRVHQLERECSTMKKVIEKIDKAEGPPQDSGGRWRGSLIRRFGCKFKTQVCDSHESAVMNGRRRRHHQHQQ